MRSPIRSTLIEACVQAGMLVIFMAILDLAQMEAGSGGAGRGIVLDMVVVASTVLLAAAAAWAGMRRAEWVLRLLALVMGTLLVCQHQYLLKTGGLLTGPMMMYGVTNPRSAMVMVGPEIGPSASVQLAAIPLLVAAAAWVAHRLRLRPDGGAVGAFFLLMPPFLVLWTSDADSRIGGVGRFESLARATTIADDLPLVTESSSPYSPPELGSPPGATPDVVLIVLESTRRDVVEGAAPPMPALAQLGRDGKLFSRAYTTRGHTSKALVGIICGMYPRPELQVTETAAGMLPLVCLPHLLRPLGYHTEFVQSAQTEFENRPGLVSNFGFHRMTGREELSNDFLSAGYLGKDEFALLEPIRRAGKSAAERPLFLTVLTSVSHYPYTLPGESHPGTTGAHFPPLPVDAYRRTLEYSDLFLERAINTIGESRDLNNTLLIVVGDHGEAFGEHGTHTHGLTPHEEGVGTVMVLRYPNGGSRARGGEDTSLRQHVDILPTVLDSLGVDWSGNLPGRSLFDPEGHEIVFSACWDTNYCRVAIAEDGLKLVYRGRIQPASLYDLMSDPEELRDLGGLPAYVPRILDLRQRLARHVRFVEQSYASP